MPGTTSCYLVNNPVNTNHTNVWTCMSYLLLFSTNIFNLARKTSNPFFFLMPSLEISIVWLTSSSSKPTWWVVLFFRGLVIVLDLRQTGTQGIISTVYHHSPQPELLLVFPSCSVVPWQGEKSFVPILSIWRRVKTALLYLDYRPLSLSRQWLAVLLIVNLSGWETLLMVDLSWKCTGTQLMVVHLPWQCTGLWVQRYWWWKSTTFTQVSDLGEAQLAGEDVNVGSQLLCQIFIGESVLLHLST